MQSREMPHPGQGVGAAGGSQWSHTREEPNTAESSSVAQVWKAVLRKDEGRVEGKDGGRERMREKRKKGGREGEWREEERKRKKQEGREGKRERKKNL